MAGQSEEAKQLIAAHRKIVAATQKILNETKELVSLLKGDIERQEELLIAQHKELDGLLDNLEIKDQIKLTHFRPVRKLDFLHGRYLSCQSHVYI